jgi:hypothetical protein
MTERRVMADSLIFGRGLTTGFRGRGRQPGDRLHAGQSGKRWFCDEAAFSRNVIKTTPFQEGRFVSCRTKKCTTKAQRIPRSGKNIGWRMMFVCVFVAFVVKNLDAANTGRPICEARAPVVHVPNMVAPDDRQFTRLPCPRMTFPAGFGACVTSPRKP